MIRYGVVLAAVFGLAADTVTLNVGTYINANHVRAFAFQGAISSRQGGEYVGVLGRECGAQGERLVAGTQTGSGGSWRVENPLTDLPYTYVAVYSGSTFRARWNGSYSAPVEWRLPAQPRVAKISGTRTWVAHVLPATPSGRVGFQGKAIELQRLSPSAGGFASGAPACSRSRASGGGRSTTRRASPSRRGGCD